MLTIMQSDVPSHTSSQTSKKWGYLQKGNVLHEREKERFRSKQVLLFILAVGSKTQGVCLALFTFGGQEFVIATGKLGAQQGL